MDTNVVRGAHPDYKETRLELAPKERRVFHICGMGNGLDFGLHNNSLRNLRRGILERIFYVEGTSGLTQPAQPIVGVFKRLKPLRNKLVRLVGMHTPIPRSQYPGLYRGRRLTIYTAAYQSLCERPIERKDAYVKTFVKAEKINFSKKPDPAPRVIQPRDVRYNLEVGRYLKTYEHYLYQGIDKLWSGPTVIKGYTCEEIGDIMFKAWSEFQKPCAIGFDMSRFDQHVSVSALEFEHSVYNAAFKSAELRQLLSWQLVNKGYGRCSDGKVKYSVKGRRMSGDINTAMGNCLLSCLITKYLMRGIKCRLLNNGDDCVVICETSDEPHVVAALDEWTEFGFKCVAEPTVYVLEEMQFCQLQPVFDGEKWIAVRDPRVSLSKDSYSINAWSNVKAAKTWLRAIGECGMALTGGIPILQSYYNVYLRTCPSAGKIKGSLAFDSGMTRLSFRMKRQFGAVNEQARVSFYRAFGFTPREQVLLEEEYDSMDPTYSFMPKGILWKPEKIPPLLLNPRK